MSTFERVKRNILRDMAGSKTHTSESWANIMLTHTNRLTDVKEQKKFWAWIQNPEDSEDIVDPIIETFEKHVEDIPSEVTVSYQHENDEKAQEIVLENTVERNGMAVFIKTVPKVV